MIKEIRYGYSNYMEVVLPIYIRTDKKEYMWSEPDLLYFDDSGNMYSLYYVRNLIQKRYSDRH